MRRLGIWLAVLATASACASTTELRESAAALLTGTQAQPLRAVYTSRTEAGRAVVRVTIEDSFRFRERLELDGRPVLERVVYDDALAVRVLDERALPGLASLPRGEWLVDPTGGALVGERVAPGERGLDPLADALDIAAYALESLAAGVVRHDPDSLTYSPADDPFPAPRDAEERLDVVRPPLPGRTDRQEFPVTAHFRSMSLYVAGGELVRLLETVSIDGHPSVRRARERGTDPALLDVVAAVAAGDGPERVVERSVSWRVLAPARGPIRLPRGRSMDLRALDVSLRA